jgi:hypothetical protein
MLISLLASRKSVAVFVDKILDRKKTIIAVGEHLLNFRHIKNSSLKGQKYRMLSFQSFDKQTATMI